MKKFLLVALSMLACSTWAVYAEEAPTYAKDIAPILYKHCATCHRPDGGAPFSFMDEKDPLRRHKLIAYVTKNKEMPPWKVTDSDYTFRNYRGLTDEEIELIQAWSQAGAPEGDLSKLPTPPEFPEEWHIGTPDVVIQEEDAFKVPAEGPDIYRSSVMAIPPTPEGKYIRALEYLPSAKSSSHHCLIYVEPTGNVREYLNERKDEVVNIPVTMNRDRIEAWAVGQIMYPWPKGCRRSFPEGTDLVLQTHFHPTGKAEISQSKLGIFYTDDPPTRHFVNFDVPWGFGMTHSLEIPPGESNYTVYDEFEVKADIYLRIIYPHAHMLCTGMESVAHFPDGTQKLLIRMGNWDFDWQERYIFSEEIFIPKGTIFKNEFWYDNSENNPFNPFSPPQVIRFGPESTDEMSAFTYGIVSDKKENIDIVFAELARKTIHDLKNADMTIPARTLWRAEALPRLDTNDNGKMEFGELVAFIRKESEKSNSRNSTLGMNDVMTDDLGIRDAFRAELGKAYVKLAITYYWHFLIPPVFILLLLLFVIYKIFRITYRKLRPITQ